ncbi:hypothetical protein ACLB2K_028192 [Fragaria x ananassa]
MQMLPPPPNASTTAINNNTKTTNATYSIDQEKNINPTVDNTNNKTLLSIYTFNEARTEEDESSSAVLLQQHKEEIVETSIMETLFADHASSKRRTYDLMRKLVTPTTTSLNKTKDLDSMACSIVTMPEDNFEDCYVGLVRDAP